MDWDQDSRRLRGALRSGGLALVFACIGLSSQATLAKEAHHWKVPGDFVFVRETIPQSIAANVMLQDPQGYLWIGGNAGLLRWDGYGTRLYAPEADTPGSLSDNNVTALCLDADGQLWVGTNAGGVSRFDPQTDSFVPLRVGPGGLRDASVVGLNRDDGNGLWIATRAGLDHLDLRSGRIVADPDSLSSGQVEVLLRDHKGNLWIGTSQGLLRRVRGGHGFSKLALPMADGGVPSIRTLYEDEDGRVWVGTNGHGAFVVDPGQAWARRVVDASTHNEWMSDTVRGIVQGRAGEVWLATRSNGLVIAETKTGQMRHIRHDDSRTSSLASNELFALFRDRDGRLWISSSAEISWIDPNQQVVDTYYGGADHLVAAASIYAVFAAPDGRVWLGQGSGGVQIIDPIRGRDIRLVPDPHDAEHALPASTVSAIALAGDGGVLLASDGGLFHAALDGSHIQRLHLPPQVRTNDVRALWADRDQIWIGSRDGLWEVLMPAKGPPVQLRRMGPELGDTRVGTIVRGPGSTLWVGTFGGLAQVDTVTGTVSRIPLDADDPNTKRSWDVISVLTDHSGRMWIGTFGRGILVENGRDARGRRTFQRLTTRDGLPDNGVDMLLLDVHGNVWASTDAGIGLIDARTLRVQALREAQGVGITGYWTGSGDALPGGELLFGGTTGLSVVQPERVARSHPDAPIVITDVRVGDRPVPAALLLGKEPFEIGPQNPSIMVEFASLGFVDPGLQRYSYRLLGFDSDWIQTPPSRRLASYTNLSPGRYTLQLRAAQPNGAWIAPLEVPILVRAAWYQRDLVRATGILLLAAGVVAVIHLRTLYLRRRQKELQRLIAERTSELELRTLELQRSHEDLRRSQEQLEKMAYFDPLTGLPNRRMFNDDLRHLIARSLRGQGDFALVLVDLDGFKQINDLRGHQTGDELLVVVADRLRAIVRDSDRIARLGGDEFAVLLTDADDPQKVEAMCARMTASLREPMLVGGQIVQVTASLGIAPCPREGKTPDELYKAADMALYASKRSGRDTWRWSNFRSLTLAP